MAELIWDGKYVDGKRQAPVRVALPFQTIETVNESAADRQRTLDLFAAGRQTEWRNRLIWGDKKYVLPSLLPEFAGKVSLIYIDPPFDTGADFSYIASVPPRPSKADDDPATFLKEPSILEQKAYRDTWGAGLDSYLKWFYETAVLVDELLAENGSLFVHLDWHVGHYAKAILDEVLGQDNFKNEIVWWYYNKLQGNVNHFAKNHDVIFYYAKSKASPFQRIQEKRDKPMRQQKRVWDSATGTLKQGRDADGNLEYYTVTERLVDDVWRMPYIMPADQTQNLRYPTQKPEALIERVISATSTEGDLVLDCFAGSGTTAAVAEKLNRRWITCDLGRFAIHTTRKRLLSIPDVKPFVVQNLGKYERQAWQTAEFPAEGEQRAKEAAYQRFILDLYRATRLPVMHGCTGFGLDVWFT
ncbi:MAG TPA: site-specific DNA-methyltransferase [Acidobacteriaceae bacterium]|nr:site-specific DNA-methyltransferase [Acidobacteriaceae bacterium]